MCFQRLSHCAVVMLLAVPFASADEWQDSTGLYKRSGDFTKLDRGMAHFVSAEGNGFHIPLTQLRASDQQRVVHLAKQEQPSQAPEAVPPAEEGAEAAPAIEGAEEAQALPFTKSVYRTRSGTFHLFNRSNLGSTAAYWMGGYKYLASLRYYGSDRTYDYYQEFMGQRNVLAWRVSRYPFYYYHCGCRYVGYPVDYYAYGYWYRYGWASRERLY